MEGMKVLITGASGQVGRGLVHVLSKKNEVHAVARFSDPAIREEVEKKVEKTWQMDMGVERAAALPADFDVVLHEAVNWSHKGVLKEQNASFHLSCTFVGDLIYRNEKAVFVLGSTGSVYEAVEEGGCKEDETPLHGWNTYVLAKIAMTQVARWICATFDRKVAVIRYWYPYAPYKPHSKVDAALAGQVYGGSPNGINERTYVQNHIENTIKAAEHAANPPEIFNSATDEYPTMADLAKIGAKTSGAALDPKANEPGEPKGDGHSPCLDKMIRLLGPTKIRNEEGFRRYWRARQEKITWPEDWMFEEPT